MCFCLITICFHMPNVFYLFVELLLICQRWPMLGLIKVFYSILFYRTSSPSFVEFSLNCAYLRKASCQLLAK